MALTQGWSIPFYILLTIVSCGINVFFLEHLVGTNKDCSNLVTFTSFLFISIDGIIFTSRGFTKKPVVPISYNALMVVIFFLSNVANNLVFKYHVPMTLHMIFKSGSLITSLFLGVILLKRSYSLSKYISVVMVTAGIILTTYASAKHIYWSIGFTHVICMHSPHSRFHETVEDTEESDLKFNEFMIGISLMAATLFSSSYMGILQERVAQKFGKHPRETLFYNHILPLPFFIFLYKDLMTQIGIFNNSEPFEVPVIGITMPYLWLLLICNTLFQYVCINAVFQLTSSCTSLTVTLVVTIRKFISLLVSIFYFGNPFTTAHWIGTVLVFAGSGLFTDLHKVLITSKSTDDTKKTA